ncbi:glutamate--ammonia ligase [Micromonospora rosaria]|uniref:Glutamate--ammonia ligase n=1 Tax=Micromonospora rosaria TaxID=47874 RepID=A0A136PZK6_9ACTN|nr:type III glutamate--ammonia ligase [Micromonospora rosaria]KXK63813.1 glutamate--ammonia ligase [Micromonospora rosaria]
MTAPPTDLDDLLAATERDGIEFVLMMFVNLSGKPCAKLTPVAVLPELARTGIGFAGHAAGELGQSAADPDVVAMPDPRSYAPMPWQPGLAVLQCDLWVEGAPWPYSPRVILRRETERLRRRGQVLKVGAEPEYFLLERDPGGGLRVADPLDDGHSPCYDARAATRAYGHLTEVSRTLDHLGWGNYSNDHEDAHGQFEHNFGYADALTTADRVVLFRYLVHTLAQRAGRIATFMPKPFAHLTGNGLHLHLSLWSTDGDELFAPGPDDAAGLSGLGSRFVAGILAHAPGLMALTCPTVNSYKRLGAGSATASGASWAPGYASWGGNNRTQMLRVPADGRVEVRCVDGAANPYLALAGLLAAGLDGIDRHLDPGPPNTDDLERGTATRGAARLPQTLLHAVDELAVDGVLRQGLGKVPGGEYVDYYVAVKRAEFADYHAQVTDWELSRYLTGC